MKVAHVTGNQDQSDGSVTQTSEADWGRLIKEDLTMLHTVCEIKEVLKTILKRFQKRRKWGFAKSILTFFRIDNDD